MAACGSDFHGALGEDLAFDVGEVGDARRQGQRLRYMAGQGETAVPIGAEVGTHLQQRCGRVDRGVGHQGGFVGIGLGQDKAARMASVRMVSMQVRSRTGSPRRAGASWRRSTNIARMHATCC